MKIDLNLQKYVDWKVNGIMQIKDVYGYRVKLVYADGSELVQQKSGFQTVKEAENSRMETIGQLYTNTYVVYEKISVKDFYEFWLESVMRPQITNDTYKGYESKIRNHIIPQIGKRKLSTLSRADVQKLYNKVFKKSKSVGIKNEILLSERRNISSLISKKAFPSCCILIALLTIYL